MQLPRSSSAALLAALALSAALNLSFAHRSQDLHERNGELLLRARYPYSGMVVPTFRATGHDGQELVIGEGE